MTKNVHYVYILRRPDQVDPLDSTQSMPFYVGKGQQQRLKNHREQAKKFRRTEDLRFIDNPHKINVIYYLWDRGLDFEETIYTSNLSEQEAYDLEERIIALYGRKADGGCLTNILSGGSELSQADRDQLILFYRTSTEIKYCDYCGKVFGNCRRKGKVAWEKRRWCSDKCRKDANRKMYSIIFWCKDCGKLVPHAVGKTGLCRRCAGRVLVTSEEHKKKQSLSQLNYSKGHKGKPLSIEHRRNLSRSLKSRKMKTSGKRYRDQLGYVEIKYCQNCGNPFGRERYEKEYTWEKHKYCGAQCRNRPMVTKSTSYKQLDQFPLDL